jgi:hypothetical protein
LFEQVEGVKPQQVKHGRSNRWKGISGFPHQIDVSVEGEKDILLAECKCWKRKVDVPRFLTFFARLSDIRLGLKEQHRTIYAAVVTTKGFQSGITKLAPYCDIKLHTVTSPTDFVAQYKDHFFISKGDQVSLEDDVVTVKLTTPKADNK